MEPISSSSFKFVQTNGVQVLLSMDSDQFLRHFRSGTLPIQPIVVTSHLRIDDSFDLTKLPRNLRAVWGLDLSGCTSLTALPDRLQVNGDLNLNGCTSLTELPEGLYLGGYLELSGCTSLTFLPAGLHVPGNLALNGCTSLRELPEGLQVEGSLALNGCTSLRELREGLQVGGSLNLNGCTSLIALPNDIIWWGRRASGGLRVVELGGSGLSDALIDHFRATEAPGMYFL